ncbi:MAG TPA: asparagine synthase (glutamine-hydrolyzing) [Oculatellaceae cyanobacterium]|jgi:asparagine synthase (glutamine-hydrolysing)
MCGIAGYFCTDSSRTPERALVWNMVKHLRHRGPDAQDVAFHPGIALGHARLRIIDLDARSKQPMEDPELGYTITFDGKIYNYLELREELIALGHTFRTHSDTEVILKAYDQWGPDCLNRFNGMWAFVLFDARSGQIFAARDRFGIKPFIYGQRENGDLVFASEAKSIIHTFPEFKKPNLPFLINFIEQGNFAAYQETFYQGLYNLLPGHYFFAKPGISPKQFRYWVWQPLPSERMPSDAETLSEFQNLLKDSIRVNLRSDVPVGVCIEDGIDGAVIAGLAAELSDGPLPAFSCSDFDVSDSEQNAAFPNFLDFMRRCVWEQDSPMGGPAVVSQRTTMELAQGKVAVVLNGQGADEVLGGGASYFSASILAHARDFISKPTISRLLSYKKAAKAIQKRTGEKQPNLCQLYRWVKKDASFQKKRYTTSALDGLFELPGDDLNTRLLEALFLDLPDWLHYADRNSVTFSLEARSPYLDHRLVAHVFSLPHQFKIRDAQTKWLLAETVKGISVVALEPQDKTSCHLPIKTGFVAPEVAGEVEAYFLQDNMLLQMISEKTQKNLCVAWEKLKKNHKLNLNDECLLWRYVTSQIFLEQLETLSLGLSEVEKETASVQN